MEIDRFTKTVLLAIALFLGVIAFGPIFQPDLAVADNARPNSFTFASSDYRWMVVMDKNGKLWRYDLEWPKTAPEYIGTFVEPGKALVVD